MEKIDFNKVKPLGDIQKLCDDVVEKYRRVERDNERLRTENEKLASGIWKEERCGKLKEEHAKMQVEWLRGFPISEDEEKLINEFKEKYYKKPHNYGAIGGAFTYKFTPTSIGVIGVIEGPDGQELKFKSI